MPSAADWLRIVPGRLHTAWCTKDQACVTGTRKLSRLVSLVGFFAVLLFCSAEIESQTINSASEQSIKAAYLYKFADYVEWPQYVFGDPATPLTIGVVGADSLARELYEMTRGRVVNGRPVLVRLLGDGESLKGIHVLFIGAAENGELLRLRTEAQQHSVLVVTEAGDALSRGSIINFRPVDKRIRFDVSLDSADRSGLRLSARLLAVAAYVQPRTK